MSCETGLLSDFIHWEKSQFNKAGGEACDRRISRIWRVETAIAISQKDRHRSNSFEAAETLYRMSGREVVIRASGGGVVPQGPGRINLSLIYSTMERLSIDGSYDLICSIVENALAELGVVGERNALPGSFCDGRHNILVDGRKLVGVSQKWRPSNNGMTIVLAHAVILGNVSPLSVMDAAREFCDAAGLDVELDRNSCTSLLEQCRNIRPESIDDTLCAALTRACHQVGFQSFHTAI